MKILFSIWAICISATLLSQNSGEIKYTEIFKPDLSEMPEIPNLEGFDIDISSFMPDSIVTEMALSFTPEASLYTSAGSSDEPAEHTFEQSDENSAMQISMSFSNEDESATTYREVNDSMMLVQSNFMGQKFLISEKASNYVWKFHNDKISYLGFECLKASTVGEEGEELIVWYTPQIPASAGPADFSGLPGLILMVSSADGNFQIKATDINLDTVPEIKKPKKGKKVSHGEFMKIQEEKTKELEKMYGGDGNSVIIIQD